MKEIYFPHLPSTRFIEIIGVMVHGVGVGWTIAPHRQHDIMRGESGTIKNWYNINMDVFVYFPVIYQGWCGIVTVEMSQTDIY